MFLFPAPVSTRRNPSLLDQFFSDRIDVAADAARVPAMDVAETDTGYELAFEVPGVTRDRLKLSVQGRRVLLETTAPEAPAEGAPRLLYRERAVAQYARTVVLPAEVDTASAAARFDNGVLTVTLAKKVPTGATQISIG